MTLKRNRSSRLHLRLFTLLSVIGLSVVPVWGETVLIESRTCGGTATPCLTPNPPYLEVGTWSSSGSHTAASGTTTTGIGSRFSSSGTPAITLTPALIAGASYAMETSHIFSNASTNLLVNITYSDCTGSSTNTTVF